MNSNTDKEREDQDEEKWCKSIIARRNREKHAILPEVGER